MYPRTHASPTSRSLCRRLSYLCIQKSHQNQDGINWWVSYLTFQQYVLTISVLFNWLKCWGVHLYDRRCRFRFVRVDISRLEMSLPGITVLHFSTCTKGLSMSVSLCSTVHPWARHHAVPLDYLNMSINLILVFASWTLVCSVFRLFTFFCFAFICVIIRTWSLCICLYLDKSSPPSSNIIYNIKTNTSTSHNHESNPNHND